MTDTTPIDVALIAYDAGLCVIPPREDGSKRPDGLWRAYQQERPDRDQVQRWYANGRTGVGVLTGAVSGNLEMLEFEGRARDEWHSFVAACRDGGLEDVLDRIVTGYAELTPGGGIHLLYRCDTIEGNRKLARRPATNEELADDPDDKIKTLIETRGEGGFVIVAPSHGTVHPSGLPWILRSGGFATIATITGDERDRLFAIAATFDQLDTPAVVETDDTFDEVHAVLNAAATGDGWVDDTISHFNRATTWADILVGWQIHHEHNGITYWTRPGKDPRHGWSATTNSKGTDRLIVFSSSVVGFDTYTGGGLATSYDRFSAYTVLHHAGDRVDAARTLRDQGYGRSRADTPTAPPHVDNDTGEIHDHEPDDNDLIVPGTSWRRTDLAAVVHGIAAGHIDRPTPTIGRYTSGADGALWYRGRVNGLYGEPGKGKTMLAVAVAAQCLNDGHTVAWIDIEEPAVGIVQRLLDLGATATAIIERFAHYAPEEPIRHALGLFDELARLAPAFVVIDSTGEALALEGAKPNNDDEVANWFRTWPRRIATRTGAAVIVIDHVVKDETTRGLWPGGSQRKKAAINGAASMLTPIRELGRGVDGRLKITTSKDRSGIHRTGTKAAEFALNADGQWDIEGATEGAEFRPTHLMEAVSRFVQMQGEPVSKNAIIRAVSGKTDATRKALELLVDEGFITRFKNGQSYLHDHVRPYTEAVELLGGDLVEEDEVA